MLDLYEELTAIAAAPAVSGKPYALIGGLAVSLHARPRATEDIDILVLPEHLPSIARALSPRGYLPTGNAMPFAEGSVSIQRFAKTEGHDLLTLDLLLASDQEMCGAIERSMKLNIGSAEISVATSEDLVSLKKKSGTLQDLADIAALTGSDENR